MTINMLAVFLWLLGATESKWTQLLDQVTYSMNLQWGKQREGVLDKWQKKDVEALKQKEREGNEKQQLAPFKVHLHYIFAVIK